MNKPLFGYHKVNTDPGSPAISALLYSDGILVFRMRNENAGTWSKATYRVSDRCVQDVASIIDYSGRNLQAYAREINGETEYLEDENYFQFGDVKIIDWDWMRCYLEEEREKHPEYYKNALKVDLTENYVRGIFDEICRVIEHDTKKIQGFKTFYSGF